MHGRYPDFNVLDEADHWDEVTRELVLDRVARVPEIRFFDVREAATLGALCDQLSGQVGEEPKIPVLNYVDEKLFEGDLDGYRYFDMPDDRDTWRVVGDRPMIAVVHPRHRKSLSHRHAVPRGQEQVNRELDAVARLHIPALSHKLVEPRHLGELGHRPPTTS